MHRRESFVHFVDKIGKLLTYAFLPLPVAKLSAELLFSVLFFLTLPQRHCRVEHGITPLLRSNPTDYVNDRRTAGAKARRVIRLTGSLLDRVSGRGQRKVRFGLSLGASGRYASVMCTSDTCSRGASWTLSLLR